MQTRSYSLLGKTAIVTGSSRGIGRGVAERLARDGAAVVVNYRNNGADADTVVSTIHAAGGRAVAVQADVSHVAEVRRLFETAHAIFGHVDILVTNAGIVRWGLLSDLTEDDFDAVFRVNAKGTFFALREAARTIENGGRIINIASSATALTLPGLALYAASKAASAQFAKILAKELGGRQVTVNSISPGYTVTDMLPDDAAFRTSAADMSLLGRLGQPSDIADVVAFLASDDARWITGQNIQAGGGLVC